MARADEENVKLALLRRRDFVSQAALAKECEIRYRSTMKRMLERLEAGGLPLEWDDQKRVRVNRAKLLLDLRLTLDEALAVFIACRLLARHSDKPNEHVIDALTKLGAALKGSTQVIGDHILASSERLKRKPTRADREYVRALEELTRAWADRTRVYLYTSGEPNQPRKFDPYFLEPSMYAVYVIGYDHLRQDIRTFKVQWLKRVSLTAEPFEIMPGFNPYDHLGHAWGINWGKGEMVQVRLKFTGNAAERVGDNIWHDSQDLSPPASDGSRVLSVWVGDTKEMIPWIRQWGPECQVLAPDSLRMRIAEDARAMARVYDTITATS